MDQFTPGQEMSRLAIGTGDGFTHGQELRATCGQGSTVIGRQYWRSQRDDLNGKEALEEAS